MVRAKEAECAILSVLVASLLTSAHPVRSDLLRLNGETTATQVSNANGIKRTGDTVRELHANAPKNIHTRCKNHSTSRHGVLEVMNISSKEKEVLENYFPSVSVLLRERKSRVIGTPNFLAEKIYWASRHRGEVKETEPFHPRSVDMISPDSFTELARNTESEHTVLTEKSTPNSQTTKPVQHTHSRTEAPESSSPTQVKNYGIPHDSSGEVKGHFLKRNVGEIKVAVAASQKSDDAPLDINDETEQQAVFFWSWQAAVIVSLPILCVVSLLLLGFLTRARLGVRIYRFFKWTTTFDLEVSRRIGLNLEEPHVFRTDEAVTDQGEAKSGACVGIDLKYYPSSKSYVSYFDANGSLESYNSQYGSEGNGKSRTRSCGSLRILERNGSVVSGMNHRGSTESQSGMLRLWGKHECSTESRASIDSQLSLQRRGSEDSQRSFMMLWYAARHKGSVDSQLNNDTHSLSSTRDRSDNQWTQMAERHESLDSRHGSLESREGQDEMSESGTRTKRRDSPKYLEATLQEAALQATGKSKTLDLGEERRYSRTLSLIHEEDKDEHHL